MTKNKASCDQIEQEILDKGLTAPRVTLSDIESAIVKEHYFTAAEGLFGSLDTEDQTSVYSPLHRLTFCILELRNGYTVTGESACVSIENFDKELGQKIARLNAIEKCWPLFGFHLASIINPLSVGE
jgi:hypothetical protein